MDEESALTETEKVDDAEEPPYKRFKYLSSVLNERLKEQGKTQISQQSQPDHEELERYLSEPIARENEDPLDFWTTNQNKYPHQIRIGSKVPQLTRTKTIRTLLY